MEDYLSKSTFIGESLEIIFSLKYGFQTAEVESRFDVMEENLRTQPSSIRITTLLMELDEFKQIATNSTAKGIFKCATNTAEESNKFVVGYRKAMVYLNSLRTKKNASEVSEERERRLEHLDSVEAQAEKDRFQKLNAKLSNQRKSSRNLPNKNKKDNSKRGTDDDSSPSPSTSHSRTQQYFKPSAEDVKAKEASLRDVGRQYEQLNFKILKLKEKLPELEEQERKLQADAKAADDRIASYTTVIEERILTLKRTNDSKSLEVHELETEASRLRKHIDDMKTNVPKLQNEARNLLRYVQNAKRDIHNFQEQKIKLNSQLTSVKAGCNQTETELNELNARVAEKEKDRVKMDNTFTKLTGEVKELQNKTQAARQQRNEYADKNHGLENKIKGLKRKAESKSEEVQNLKQIEIKEVQNFKDLSERISVKKMEMNTLNEQLNKLRMDHLTLRGVLNAEEEKVELTRKQIQERRSQKVNLESEFRTLMPVVEKAKMNLNAEFEQLREIKAERKLKVAERDTLREVELNESRDISRRISLMKEEKKTLHQEVKQLENENLKMKEVIQGEQGKFQLAKTAIEEKKKEIDNMVSERMDLESILTSILPRVMEAKSRLENLRGRFISITNQISAEEMGNSYICTHILEDGTECGASFRHRQALSRHKRTHNEPRFKCEECKHPFFRKDHFHKHRCSTNNV